MNAIKESFDNLPAAICIFSSKWLVRLMNRRMLAVGAMLLGSGIQTLGELQAVLKPSRKMPPCPASITSRTEARCAFRSMRSRIVTDSVTPKSLPQTFQN